MSRATATEMIRKLRDDENKDFAQIAEAMNKKGTKTRTGKAWNVANVRYVYHTSKIAERATTKRAQSGGKPKSDPNAVKLILDLYAGGSTPAEISEALTENGYKTATGVAWNKDNVRKLIQVYRKNPPTLRALNGARKGPKAIPGMNGHQPNLQQELTAMFSRFDEAGISIASINREGGKINVTYLTPKTESFEPVAIKAAA
jgi:hypothetical protein